MSDFKDLFERYLDGHLSAEEIKQLLDGISAENGTMSDLIDGLLKERTVQGLGDPRQEEILFNRIMESDRLERQVHRLPVYRRLQWWAAASIFLLAATSGYYWYHQHNTPGRLARVPAEVATTIPAGSKGAILTLSNGDKVSLDSAVNGTVALQNGVPVALNNGQLSYGADRAATDIVSNTLSTPRGREFSIVLPDGTKAWLNSASSIKYPTAFTGHERSVEVTGEVYFEVATNADMPFRVKINKEISVDVLGTHFNINAYPDEKNIVATLSEGAIRLNASQESKVLSPGQQAGVSNLPADKKQISIIENADITQVLAWKDGFFDFNQMPFDQVMRQLSRWYDIDVVYENGVPDIGLEGTLGRDVSLAKILFFLGKVGVHCHLEGKRLVISQ